MAKPHILANSPKTFLDRDNWMRAVLASDLPDNAKAVALTIALHLRVKTGTCNPSYPTLAAESHVGERSTYRLVALLESAGWLSVQRTQGRLSNQYVLLNPANYVAGLNPAKSTIQPCHTLAGKKRKRKIPSGGCYASPLMVGERDRASRESIPSIGGGPLDAPADLFGQQAERPETKTETEPVAPKRTPEGESAERIFNPATAVVRRENNDGDWCELRALWRRPWPDTPKALAIARQAFERACREGAEPEEILDAAKTWVAAFTAGDGVRYLPALATWLAARGWETLPPKKKRKRRGNKPYGKGYSRRDQDDDMHIALSMGGYVEDENGNQYHPDGYAGSAFDWRPAS